MATHYNESVQKSFAILNLLRGERREITAAIVARELGLNAVTAHRFLRTLEHVGALVAVRKGAYSLGYALADLGERAARGRHLASVLQPFLDMLAEELNESVLATRFEDGMAVCIATAVCSRPLIVDMRVGSRLEAYASTHGKLWLANMTEADLERYLASTKLKPIAPNTITDPAMLLAELEEVRTRGFALNMNERDEALYAVGAPVRARDGRMVAGISVFGPPSRFDAAFRKRAAARLLEIVDEAGDALRAPE